MSRIFFPLVVVLCVAWSARASDALSAFGNGEGVNGTVYAVVAQPDGRFVIGGEFNSVNGVPRGNMARLNSDGTVDPTFLPQFADGPQGPVYALLLLPDGGVVAGGLFNGTSAVVRHNILKFDAQGNVDTSFASQNGGTGTNGPVRALALQPDGRILVGGQFNTFLGQQRFSICRLTPEGQVDGPVPAAMELGGTVNAISPGGSLAGGAFRSPMRSAPSLLKID